MPDNELDTFEPEWDTKNEGLDRIHLTTRRRESVDMADSLYCSPEVVAVELDFEPELMGGLVVSDETAGYYRPDTGTVVAIGSDVPLKQGQRVCVSYYHGIGVAGTQYGRYKPQSELVLFGHATHPWWRGVIGVEDMESPIGYRPPKNHVILRKDDLVEKEGSIYLPDDAKYVKDTATVASVGIEMPKGYDHLKVGDKVIYSHKHIRNFMDGNMKVLEYGVIECKHIFAVVDECTA